MQVKSMTLDEFEIFKFEYFQKEDVKERYQTIHDRFEKRVNGAIKLRDRARNGLADEEISITLYGWIQRYLSLTDRYDRIENVELEGTLGTIIVDYFTEEIVFEAK